MVAHLRPCTSCARHVRANATSCPFCSASLEVDTQEPAVPHERLGRAARMAFGGAAAMALTVAIGCGKDNKENIAMPYGAPPNPTPALPDSQAPDAGPKENIMMPYGAPPTPTPAAPEAGAPDATATALDAGAKKKTQTAPTPTPTPNMNHNKPYGAPPADGFDIFDV